ncbi:hypothetical protein C8R44DRAFT_880961 [Mycena epipterygia]|nr:hypothetical protein C8R44DRAFT_880961 [Mycena epipterygia]
MARNTRSRAQAPSSRNNTGPPSSTDRRFVGSTNFTVIHGIFNRTRRNDSTVSASESPSPWSGGAIAARSRDFRIGGGEFTSDTINVGPVSPSLAPIESQSVVFLDSHEFAVLDGTFNIVTKNYANANLEHKPVVEKQYQILFVDRSPVRGLDKLYGRPWHLQSQEEELKYCVAHVLELTLVWWCNCGEIAELPYCRR